MATRPVAPPASRSGRPSLRSRWPVWAGYGAAVWSLTYGLLGLYWALGGAGFPFGTAYDKDARGSLLERAHPDTTGPVIAAIGLAGAALALVMRHRPPAGRSRAASLGFAVTEELKRLFLAELQEVPQVMR